jgi:charged multivesicular body protein 3
MFGGIFSGINLFGNAPPQQTPEEQGKEWKKKLRREGTKIDRNIRRIDAEVKKIENECKKLASKGRKNAALILVKQIAATRKQITRMYTAKAQLNSVSTNLQLSISQMKLQGILGKSTTILHEMNELAKLPEMTETMKDMAKEMMRAGIIEESLDDAFATMEPDDLEEESDAELNKLFAEITAEKLSGTAAPTGKPAAGVEKVAAAEAQPTMDPEELNRIQSQIDAL